MSTVALVLAKNKSLKDIYSAIVYLPNKCAPYSAQFQRLKLKSVGYSSKEKKCLQYCFEWSNNRKERCKKMLPAEMVLVDANRQPNINYPLLTGVSWFFALQKQTDQGVKYYPLVRTCEGKFEFVDRNPTLADTVRALVPAGSVMKTNDTDDRFYLYIGEQLLIDSLKNMHCGKLFVSPYSNGCCDLASSSSSSSSEKCSSECEKPKKCSKSKKCFQPIPIEKCSSSSTSSCSREEKCEKECSSSCSREEKCEKECSSSCPREEECEKECSSSCPREEECGYPRNYITSSSYSRSFSTRNHNYEREYDRSSPIPKSRKEKGGPITDHPIIGYQRLTPRLSSQIPSQESTRVTPKYSSKTSAPSFQELPSNFKSGSSRFSSAKINDFENSSNDLTSYGYRSDYYDQDLSSNSGDQSKSFDESSEGSLPPNFYQQEKGGKVFDFGKNKKKKSKQWQTVKFTGSCSSSSSSSSSCSSSSSSSSSSCSSSSSSSSICPEPCPITRVPDPMIVSIIIGKSCTANCQNKRCDQNDGCGKPCGCPAGQRCNPQTGQCESINPVQNCLPNSPCGALNGKCEGACSEGSVCVRGPDGLARCVTVTNNNWLWWLFGGFLLFILIIALIAWSISRYNSPVPPPISPTPPVSPIPSLPVYSTCPPVYSGQVPVYPTQGCQNNPAGRVC